MNSTVSVALQNAVNSADAWTKRDKKPTKIFDKKSSKPHKVRQSSPQTTEKIADLIRQNKNNAAAALQEAISQGLDVNRPMPENQGEALIHVATAAGAEKILAILLSNGADVNAKDSMGETALCKAVTYDQEDSHVNLARMLLRSGANPNNRDVNGDLPLDNSSFGSNIARTIRDAGGYAKVSETGFILACQEGNVDSINDFIKAGGNVNKSFSGISALMFATANGSEASVRALLNAGAMVNVKDNNGMTALHWAAIHNQMRIAEILLQKGAKTSFKDNRGKPAGYYYYWKYGKNKNQAAKLGYPAPRNEARQRAASAKAFNEAFSALAMSMKMGLEETARQNKQRQMTPPKTASNKSGFKFTPPLTLKYQNLNLSPKSNSQKSSGQSIAVRPKIQTQASTQPQTVYWVVVERQSVGGGNLRNSARIINGGNFPSSGFSQQIGNRQWKKLTWVYGTLDANDARQYADKANQQRVSIPLTVRTAPAGNHGWVYNTDHRLPVVVLTTAANRLLRSRPGYVNPISVK
jgi:ankyrin repeat protein